MSRIALLGNATDQWGGTSCETDLTSHRITAVSLAMVHGFTLAPVYRSVTGASTRCLVSFSIT